MMITLKVIFKMLQQNRLLLLWIIGIAMVTYYTCVYENENRTENFVGAQQPLIENKTNDNIATKKGKCGSMKKVIQKCAQCHGKDGNPLLPVLEPMYNMREMCKQIILLEDHLFQTRKRCEDCICKHFLTIEALAEEAVTLDKDKKYTKYLEQLPDRIRDLQHQYIKNSDDIHEVAQGLRKIRKEMMTKSFKVGLMANTNNDESSDSNSTGCK